MFRRLGGRRGILIYCYQAAASLALFFYAYFTIVAPEYMFLTPRYFYLHPGDRESNASAVVAVLLALGNLVPPHLVISGIRSIRWQVIALVTHTITAISTGFGLSVIAALAVSGSVQAHEVPILSFGYAAFGVGYLAIGVMRPYLDPTFSQVVVWVLRESD